VDQIRYQVSSVTICSLLGRSGWLHVICSSNMNHASLPDVSGVDDRGVQTAEVRVAGAAVRLETVGRKGVAEVTTLGVDVELT
jgi:hypothetical protein